MNYSNKETHCRVDFFKDTGKWYATEEIVFAKAYFNHWSVHESFRHSLNQIHPNRFIGMTAICLEPFHKNSHPISIVWDGKHFNVKLKNENKS